VCPNTYRHYYNVCTFGYTTAFWDWKRWEREIDWMALHGINNPLAMTGQEAIWQKVFLEMGVSQKNIDGFFTGAAFLPWGRMGNVNGHAGPLSKYWIDGQVTLQKKILARERELGMKPVVPGFSGFVPKGFAEANPKAKVTRSSGWCGFEPTYLLGVSDPMFIEVGKRFITEYRKTFGTDHLYLCDTFNEMTPQLGPDKYKELHDLGASVYKSITAGDPDGIWVMQGWLFYNEANFWGTKEVEAMLGAVPEGKNIIIDLACDLMQVWKRHEAVRNAGWIYCTLHNFGQATPLTGDLDYYAATAMSALNDPNHGKMLGMGLTPEGIDQNPVLYELMTDLMWTDKPVKVSNWLVGYVRSRYGDAPSAALEAWDILHKTAYSGIGQSQGSRFYVRPGAGRGGEFGQDALQIRDALKLLLSCSDKFGGVRTYQRDVIDVAKRFMAECSGVALNQYETALSEGKKPEAAAARAKYIKTLEDIDRLLATLPEHRLSYWVGMARSWGKTDAEKKKMEENARLQVTTWGGPVLHDYACKEWAGLTKDFFIPRWNMLFDAMESGKFDAGALEAKLNDWEFAWTRSTKPALESKPENPIKVASELLASYSSSLVQTVADPGIAVGKPVRCSGTPEPGGDAKYAVDGLNGGAFWSIHDYPQWLEIDLEKATRIGSIQVVTYSDGSRYYQYTVEVSTDGQTWTKVVDMSKNTEIAKSKGVLHTFNPVDARYVRVNMLFNSANPGVHLREVRVFPAK